MTAVRPKPEGADPLDAPKYLVVLAVHPSAPQEDRLSVMLIDAAEAIDRISRASRETEAWQDRVENDIYEAAVKTEPVLVRTADTGALARYFDSIVVDDLRPMLESKGDWQRYGSIVIRADLAGLDIELDGHAIGSTEVGRTRIRNVEPGTRTIAFSRGKQQLELMRVDVQRGRTSTVTPSVKLALDESAGFRGPALVIGGIATALAGIVVTAVGIDRAAGVRAACLARRGASPASCESLGFPSFSSGSDLLPTTNADEASGTGLRIAPLGVGLIGVGSVWSLGGLLDHEEDLAFWLTVAGGLVAGFATYGIMAALGG